MITEHLSMRKEVILSTIRRKQKGIRHWKEVIDNAQQQRMRLEETVVSLRKEYEIADRELFLLLHPPSATEKLKTLEKELGKKLFAQAVALLQEEGK